MIGNSYRATAFLSSGNRQQENKIMTTIRPISSILAELSASLPASRTSIAVLLESLHERGFGFILLIFALPMALPLPVPPGINILLASPLILLTAQQALGRHTIWLPEGMKRKTISSAKLSRILAGAIPWMQRIERFVRPRLGWMTQGIASNLIGLMGLLMALTITIPLPLTNTVPSLGIALMAIGIIMRDGLSVLIGAFIGMCWILILGGVITYLGVEGIDALKESIKSFF